MSQPTDPRVAYARGQRHGAAQAYDKVLNLLEQLVSTLRSERGALELPTRQPRQRDGGEQ